MEMRMMPMGRVAEVRKRDGASAQWERGKIESAVARAFKETGEQGDAAFVARYVELNLQRVASFQPGFVPSVEQVQDEVERTLMMTGHMTTAKAYIIYREHRAQERAQLRAVPMEFRLKVSESRRYFPNALSEFVYYRTYSRWLPDLGRREAWKETVGRYLSFMRERIGDALTGEDYGYCELAMLKMEVMPSMRLMWSAGDAARATNVAAFNCSYVAPQSLADFGEILYVLACGCGVGFSAESRNVQMLPVVGYQRGGAAQPFRIEDSKEGWADALVCGLRAWYEGTDMEFDYSLLRPEGARLRTMGGRSSGPEPLRKLLQFARRLVLSRQGRRLSNLDVHDLVCKIGEVIVSGGVRRSALISLSDLDDVAIRGAKSGPYGSWPKHRELANNSAVYDGWPGDVEFMREWLALMESGTGERGVFNRGDLLDQVPERRARLWDEMGLIGGGRLMAQVGTNPCGEIYLLHKQFCNLTEAVCRRGDSAEDLARKVRVATILGTYQSTLTDFPFLSKEWRDNCERERLLGVSLTGQYDCEAAGDPRVLSRLLEVARATNIEFSERMGIGPSTAITCGKPSGTVSQLVDAASGGHPRFAPFYIRRVRINATDPLYRLLRDQGVPCRPESGQTEATARTFVFDFPVKAPAGARCADEVTAIEQLERWLTVKANFTEHNPSITVYVGADEWYEVGKWVHGNWGDVGGLAFLPREDHAYELAPYERITEEQYDAMVRSFPAVDYALLAAYEQQDETVGSKELACVAGACEL